MKARIKKTILAMIGLSFAFAMTSCAEQDCRKKAKLKESQKLIADKLEKTEKHHSRW